MLNNFTTNAHCKTYLIEIGQDIKCYLCLNNFLFLWYVHLVPNLEIIPWNVFNCYKILIKFNSLDAHALKVTIFKVILLLRRKKTQTHTFRGDQQDHNPSLRSERESIRFGPAEKFSLSIGHVP